MPEPEPEGYNLQSGDINIVNSGGNKYVFNDGDTYVTPYQVSIDTYNLTNISSAHPMAILNTGKESEVVYEVIDNTPILIKVSGGNYFFLVPLQL